MAYCCLQPSWDIYGLALPDNFQGFKKLRTGTKSFLGRQEANEDAAAGTGEPEALPEEPTPGWGWEGGSPVQGGQGQGDAPSSDHRLPGPAPQPSSL